QGSEPGATARRRTPPRRSAGSTNGRSEVSQGGIKPTKNLVGAGEEDSVNKNQSSGTKTKNRPRDEPPTTGSRPSPRAARVTAVTQQKTPSSVTTKPAWSDGGNGGGGGPTKQGKKHSSEAFEVNLLRFRGVEEIRGWKLGPTGGQSLSADLANGACPRLRVLHLEWNMVGDVGTRTLIRALSSGSGASAAGRTLQELNLRGNGISAGGSRALGRALATGAFPSLRGLDLGANALRDEGGKVVAHFLLSGAGTWPTLARLDLSGNGMGD
ncbi:unnamed protein product, partial [Sphacelaria rigidula]